MSGSLPQRRSLPDSAFSSWSNIINDNNDAQQFQQIIRDRRGIVYFLRPLSIFHDLPIFLFSYVIDVIIILLCPSSEEGQLFCHSTILHCSCSLLNFFYV